MHTLGKKGLNIKPNIYLKKSAVRKRIQNKTKTKEKKDIWISEIKLTNEKPLVTMIKKKYTNHKYKKWKETQYKYNGEIKSMIEVLNKMKKFLDKAT